jgi:hypothetical protein
MVSKSKERREAQRQDKTTARLEMLRRHGSRRTKVLAKRNGFLAPDLALFHTIAGHDMREGR